MFPHTSRARSTFGLMQNFTKYFSTVYNNENIDSPRKLYAGGETPQANLEFLQDKQDDVQWAVKIAIKFCAFPYKSYRNAIHTMHN